MIKQVKKRDGRYQLFNQQKIYNAIEHCAAGAMDSFLINEMVDNIVDSLSAIYDGKRPSVEVIQDAILEALFTGGFPEAASTFIKYRQDRTVEREKNTQLMGIMKSIFTQDSKENDTKRDNANTDTDTAMGTMLKIGSEASKEFYTKDVLKPEHFELYQSGKIHIHDLDFYNLTTTCLPPDTRVIVKLSGRIRHLTIGDLDDMFRPRDNGKVRIDNVQILSKDGKFVRLESISKRPLGTKEPLYCIQSSGFEVRATARHIIPVIRDGEVKDLFVKDIKVGDKFVVGEKRLGKREWLDITRLLGYREDILIYNSSLVYKEIKKANKQAEFLEILPNYTNPTRSLLKNKALTLRDYAAIRHLVKINPSALVLTTANGRGLVGGAIKLSESFGKILGCMYINPADVGDKILFESSDVVEVHNFALLFKKVFPRIPIRLNKEKTKVECSDPLIQKLARGVIATPAPYGSSLIPDWIYEANPIFLRNFLYPLLYLGFTFSENGFESSDSQNNDFLEQLKYILTLVGIGAKTESRPFVVGGYNARRTVLSIDSSECDKIFDIGTTNELVAPKHSDESAVISRIDKAAASLPVYDFETENHYFWANGVIVHNCTQIDLEKLLRNGFSTGTGSIRRPQSIRTAVALVAIVLQSNQNDQHGGQSIGNLDWDLAPYVNVSYQKHLKNNTKKFCELSNVCEDELSNETKTRIEEISWKDTERETYQAMEALIHNLNTMSSRAGAQVPFSSINFGMDTSKEGRLVSSSLIRAQSEGIGDGDTAIFPITIFRVKDGVNGNPGDPNYDLLQAACACAARRLFPCFSFVDAPFNLEFYKPNDKHTHVAYMGCVRGDETIKYKVNDNVFEERFSDAFARLGKLNTVKNHGISEFCELNDVEIFDSAKRGFVKCFKIIKNPDVGNWHKVTFDNGKEFFATADHPLPVTGRGRKAVSTIRERDCIPTADGSRKPFVTVIKNEFVGKIGEFSYDVETESDMFDVSGIRSHNCRTRVLSNIHDPQRQIISGRGNLSYTSINLPMLAIESKGIPDFMQSLERLVGVCCDQLYERYLVQRKRKVFNHPFLYGQGVWLDSDTKKRDEEIGDVINHGSLSVGFVGLAECLTRLVGAHHGESEKAQGLGLKIIGKMREVLDARAAKTKLNYSLVATPAESYAGRALRLTRKVYGVIEGITDKDYFTNSFHIPPKFEITIYDKIRKEAPYHKYCNAGHISYVEIDGSFKDNPSAFMKIVQCAKKSGMGYFAINVPLDKCGSCGCRETIGDECPACGAKESEGNVVHRTRRVTGYLVGDLARWNDAKRAEERDRVKHGFLIPPPQ